MQRSLRQSLLGYATLDLLQNAQKLVFGLWNGRPLKAPHVKRLALSFEHDGLERFDQNTVIPVVVKKTSISSVLTHDLTDFDKLPPLKLSDPSTLICCAGGLHRFEALGQYIEEVRKKKKLVEQKRESIKKIPNEDLTTQDIQYHNVESIKEMENYGGILEYGGQWLVAVYDESMSFLSPAISILR